MKVCTRNTCSIILCLGGGGGGVGEFGNGKGVFRYSVESHAE